MPCSNTTAVTNYAGDTTVFRFLSTFPMSFHFAPFPPSHSIQRSYVNITPLFPLISLKLKLKGAVSRYSVIFLCFFARVKNGDCSRKCRAHQTMTAWSAARTTSPPKLSGANVVFFQKMSFSAALPCGRHYFSPHKMATKITDYRDTAALNKWKIIKNLALVNATISFVTFPCFSI